MSIKVRFEKDVFRPLDDVKLEQGVEGRVRITNKKDIIKMAGVFSGIGGYKGKITVSKLEELEEEIYG